MRVWSLIVCEKEKGREREREKEFSGISFLFTRSGRFDFLFARLPHFATPFFPSFRLSLSLSLSLSNPLPLTLAPLSTRPRECEVKRFKTISLSPVSVRLSPNIFKSTAHIQVRTTPTSNLLTDVTWTIGRGGGENVLSKLFRRIQKYLNFWPSQPSFWFIYYGSCEQQQLHTIQFYHT